MDTLTANIFSEVFKDSPLNLLFGASLLIGVMFSGFLLFFHELGDLLGGLHLDLHMDHDMGGLHVDHGLDSVHAGDAHTSHDATHVSTLAVASFISSFGAFGLLSVTLFGAGPVTSLLAAVTGGIVFGIAAQAFFLYILSPTISSEVRQTRLVGLVAEIITPIPASGIGQIALIAQGSRVTYSARATDEKTPVERGTPVRIERIVGGMAYVSPIQ